jgi:hypothetical protein
MVTPSKWIDMDCIIFIAFISYNAANKIYTFDRIDAKELEKFVTVRNL